MTPIEIARSKLEWALQHCQADFQAELSEDFFDGKYRITFTKGNKQYRVLVPVEWLDDCDPGGEVSSQMDGVIETARREFSS